jgi:hypothetical protein
VLGITAYVYVILHHFKQSFFFVYTIGVCREELFAMIIFRATRIRRENNFDFGSLQ